MALEVINKNLSLEELMFLNHTFIMELERDWNSFRITYNLIRNMFYPTLYSSSPNYDSEKIRTDLRVICANRSRIN